MVESPNRRLAPLATTTLAVAAMVALHPASAEPQGRTTRTGAPPVITAGSTQTNWASHNLDLHNQRFANLDQINTDTVGQLQPRWSFVVPAGLNVAQVTPLVVDGLMYFHAGATVLGRVTIGRGATVAAGVTLAQDLPAGHVAANPRGATQILPPKEAPSPS